MVLSFSLEWRPDVPSLARKFHLSLTLRISQILSFARKFPTGQISLLYVLIDLVGHRAT